jgi:hypothetical protein
MRSSVTRAIFTLYFYVLLWRPASGQNLTDYNLSRKIGEYASRTAYCKLVINGSYRGLYLLQEKIKADINKVFIS